MSFSVREQLITIEQYQKAYDFLIPVLRTSLSSHLFYHSVQHTLSVIEATKHLAKQEKVAEQETLLLLTAALYHDAGFTRNYKNHEEASCEIARETLQQFDYHDVAIEKICRLIMVTKLPHTPANVLEEIMCDADLYYLGSANFFRESENLNKELRAEGIITSHQEWELKEIQFLEAHKYFTTTANAERAESKKIYTTN